MRAAADMPNAAERVLGVYLCVKSDKQFTKRKLPWKSAVLAERNVRGTQVAFHYTGNVYYFIEMVDIGFRDACLVLMVMMIIPLINGSS